jgi:hypothetical protein
MKQADLRVRYGRLLGLLFCVAGFIAIALGWNGMAREACADCQLPYIVSGGAGGLGLILFGIALLLMAQIRAERNRLAEQIGDAIRPLVQATATDGAGDAEVVAAKSTYHRPGCRLVTAKSDLDEMSVAAAQAKGLTPCRVCNPAEIGLGASEASAKEPGEQPQKAEASSPSV